MGSEKQHDTLTAVVADLIRDRYDYDLVQTHVDYRNGDLEGEMDIYAQQYGGRRVYVEVKSYNGTDKARRQLKRAYRAGVADQFVYVTPDDVGRWTPHEG